MTTEISKEELTELRELMNMKRKLTCDEIERTDELFGLFVETKHPQYNAYHGDLHHKSFDRTTRKFVMDQIYTSMF